jgi:hypothetical protein
MSLSGRSLMLRRAVLALALCHLLGAAILAFETAAPLLFGVPLLLSGAIGVAMIVRDRVGLLVPFLVVNAILVCVSAGYAVVSSFEALWKLGQEKLPGTLADPAGIVASVAALGLAVSAMLCATLWRRREAVRCDAS